MASPQRRRALVDRRHKAPGREKCREKSLFRVVPGCVAKSLRNRAPGTLAFPAVRPATQIRRDRRERLAQRLHVRLRAIKPPNCEEVANMKAFRAAAGPVATRDRVAERPRSSGAPSPAAGCTARASAFTVRFFQFWDHNPTARATFRTSWAFLGAKEQAWHHPSSGPDGSIVAAARGLAGRGEPRSRPCRRPQYPGRSTRTRPAGTAGRWRSARRFRPPSAQSAPLSPARSSPCRLAIAGVGIGPIGVAQCVA